MRKYCRNTKLIAQNWGFSIFSWEPCTLIALREFCEISHSARGSRSVSLRVQIPCKQLEIRSAADILKTFLQVLGLAFKLAALFLRIITRDLNLAAFHKVFAKQGYVNDALCYCSANSLHTLSVYIFEHPRNAIE